MLTQIDEEHLQINEEHLQMDEEHQLLIFQMGLFN